MKTKSLSALLVICASVAFTACGSGDMSKLFVKKWQIESIKSDAMDKQIADLKMAADTTKDSAAKASAQATYKMMTSMIEDMKKSTLEYRLDGTYEQNFTVMGQTQVDKGKWTLADGGKKVITTNDKQKVDTITISEMSADKMTVVAPDGRGSTVTVTYKAL